MKKYKYIYQTHTLKFNWTMHRRGKEKKQARKCKKKKKKEKKRKEKKKTMLGPSGLPYARKC